MESNSPPAKPNTGSSIKENLELAGRALQMLTKRVADIVDNTPAKVALGLVKAIIEINNVRYHISHFTSILTDYYSRL